MKVNLANGETETQSIYNLKSLKANSVELFYEDFEAILRHPELLHMVFMRLVPGVKK